MVFSSAFFLFYFLPVFLLVYLFTPTRYKNGSALVGSLLFYLWGSPGFFPVLIGTAIADYYLLYILLFPQLIAGPIIRFREIAAQLRDRRDRLTVEYRLNGLFRFTLGLAKKVFIADTLGFWVDQAFTGEFADLGTADAGLPLHPTGR